MPNRLHFASAILLIHAACSALSAQDNSSNPLALVVIAAPNSENERLVIIPPATSWKGTIDFRAPNAEAFREDDMPTWAKQQSALNGLQDVSAPWRIVIAYDQFDEDGDNVHRGTFEELWAGPKKYRITYKADDLNQTDFATAQGLFRLGDQQWPNPAQTQIPREVINPFFYAGTLRGVHVRNVVEKFGDHTLNCVVIENGPGRISNPTLYCFEPRGSELRYSRGAGWYQTTYNDLTSFSGRSIGGTVDVYDGGKPYLKLHVQSLEAVTDATDADFTPPTEAKNLSGQIVTGVAPVPLHQSFPEWPDSLKQQHFSVTVAIVIGRDGHVQSAHAISGPQNAFKSAEATARKWTFQPYLVLDEPAEVSTKITLNNN
jgi:hypothetical protein